MEMRSPKTSVWYVKSTVLRHRTIKYYSATHLSRYENVIYVNKCDYGRVFFMPRRYLPRPTMEKDLDMI